MSIENKVFLQLEKIQPSESKKVELGLIDDFGTSVQQLLNILGDIEGKGNRIISDKRDIERVWSIGKTQLEDCNNMLSRIESANKELGLVNSIDEIKEVKRFAIIKNLYNEYLKKYKF